jgi:hypothetical protein
LPDCLDVLDEFFAVPHDDRTAHAGVYDGRKVLLTLNELGTITDDFSFQLRRDEFWDHEGRFEVRSVIWRRVFPQG